MGRWIKREKGCWKAVTPDGLTTEWVSSLIKPEMLIDDSTDVEIFYGATYECSECGSGGWGVMTHTIPELMHYCPMCGDAKEI